MTSSDQVPLIKCTRLKWSSASVSESRGFGILLLWSLQMCLSAIPKSNNISNNLRWAVVTAHQSGDKFQDHFWLSFSNWKDYSQPASALNIFSLRYRATHKTLQASLNFLNVREEVVRLVQKGSRKKPLLWTNQKASRAKVEMFQLSNWDEERCWCDRTPLSNMRSSVQRLSNVGFTMFKILSNSIVAQIWWW